MARYERSRVAFERANQILPGGVNSPVRAFKAVGGTPIFIKRAEGSHLYDEDGNRYVDYVNSWGPAIVGHAHPEVVATISETAKRGLSFGAPTVAETTLAEKIRAAVPSMQMMRFVSSGTEACMAVMRVARAFTGRTKLIKFTGCYHGHADMFLVKAGSGALTLGLPDSPGVNPTVTADTLCVPFNDLEAVGQVFTQNQAQIAAIILEPIVGNAGYIEPVPGFLQGLRKLCDEHKALLIFDEVMTGFRVAWGGAQAWANITPDLTTLGKVVGGGMPLAVYGGREDIMKWVAPAGPVYQAGTLSGNPVAVACGLKTLELLEGSVNFVQLEKRVKELTSGLERIGKRHSVPIVSGCRGGMLGFFFHDKPVQSFEEARATDVGLFRRFFSGMLDRGIYWPPSAFEAAFISLAHTQEDIERTLEAADEVIGTLHG